MEEDFLARLTSWEPLAALVGDRIAWGWRQQGVGFPAVTLSRIDPGHQYTMTGRIRTTDALVQIDCWAASKAQAAETERAVVAALDTFKAAPFRGAFITGGGDHTEDGDGPRPDGTTEIHRARLDVRVWHTQPQ